MLVRALFALFLSACSAKSPTIHTFTSGPDGFDTSSYWLDTGREVVVVDAQFTTALAQAMLSEIEGSTDSPIRYVIATHPSPDKFNGATVFQEAGAQLVVSSQTASALPSVHAYKQAYFEGAGLFEPGGYPELPTPDVVFEERMALDVRGVPMVLHALDHGAVTASQTALVVGQTDVFVGDLAGGGTHLWLEGDVSSGSPMPALDEWLDALAEVHRLVPEGTVHPGRGVPIAASEIVEDHTLYLEQMRSLVRGYVDGLSDPVAELSGPNAGAHFEAISAEAQVAFPDRALPYLVTFGVYGLALQEAAL